MSSKLRRRLARQARKLQLKTEEARVLIATPMQDTCLAVYCRSVVQCVAYSLAQGLVIGHTIAQYSMLPLSRNMLGQVALDGGWTHILFIDSDMEFPPDLAVRLVKHHEPVVAINCMARRHPHYLTARTADSHEIVTTTDSTGLEKVARVGTGIMLIHLDVLREMPLPWFEYEWLAEKQVFRGEDFVFCDKLARAGVPVYIDHDLSKQVAHVGTFQYHPLIRAGFREVEEARLAAESGERGAASHG